MANLADFLQLALLLLNLIGLGLAGQRLVPRLPFYLHFCLFPMVLFLALFFLEHFVALRNPSWIWLPMTIGTLWLLDRHGWLRTLNENVLKYFMVGFLICLFWRVSYPDLFPHSDTLRDLSILTSACEGNGLPMNDIWVHGSKLDTYAVFQYYCGAWVHRAFGCSCALTYQLAYCCIVGYTTAAVGMALEVYTQARILPYVAVIFFAIGGNGASLLTPFMGVDRPGFTVPMRCVGSYAQQPGPNTAYLSPFGRLLIQTMGASQVDAPMDFAAYSIVIGDFHPPLSTFLILSYALLAVALSERAERGSLPDRVCVAVIVASPFVLFIANPWTAPLQLVFAVLWVLYRSWPVLRTTWSVAKVSHVQMWIPNNAEWIFTTTCAAAAAVLVAPGAITYILSNRPEIGIDWVTIGVPASNWFFLMFPAALCVVWPCARIQKLPLVRFMLLVSATTVWATIWLRFKDNGGAYEVYRTTFETWPWVFHFMMVTGLMCLGFQHTERRKVPVWLGMALVPLTLALVGNVYIYGGYYADNKPIHFGEMNGLGWLISESGVHEGDDLQVRQWERNLLMVVQILPHGVLIESDPNLGTPALVFSTFTGQHTLCGAPWIELSIRKDRSDLENTFETMKHFYSGDLPNVRSWLTGVTPGGVIYIIWQPRDNRENDNGELWNRINSQIAQDYDWRWISDNPDRPVGIWIRKNSAR